MYRLIIFLFILVPVSAKSKQGPAEQLKEKSIAQWKAGNYDSALILAQNAFDMARKDNDSLLMAKCLNNIGLIYNSKGDPVKSILYYNQSLAIIQNLNDKENLATSYLNLGIAYKEQGVYDQALIFLFQSSRLFTEMNNKRGLASAHNTIANVLMLDKMYQKALEHHFISLGLRRQLSFTEGIAGSLNNIGIVYKKLGNYDSALTYFYEALKLKDSANKEQLAPTLANIGEIHLFRKQYREAEKYYSEVLDIRLKAKNQKATADSYYDFALLYFEQKRFKDAEKYLLKSAAIAEQLNASQVLLNCYDLARKLYRKLNQSAKGLRYDDLYIIQKEKVLGELQQKMLTQMQVKYETEKKQLEIKELNQDKEKQVLMLKSQGLELENRRKNIRYLTILVILGAALLIILGLYLWSRVHYARKQDILFRELHHRVKNNLQILSSLLQLQSITLKDAEAKDAVREGESRVRAMVLIHQKLYFDKQVNQVQIADYVNDLLWGLRQAYGYTDNLHASIQVADKSMDVDKAIPLGLLLNEILTNAFKYAFRNNPAPSLSLKLEQKGRIWHLDIADNGPGIGSQNAGESFGMKLVQSQLKQLNAQMRSEFKEGLHYEISFPA